MRQFMMTVMALAVFGAMVATVHAENQPPILRRIQAQSRSGPCRKPHAPRSRL
jgi:hypothetical protein